MGRFVERTNWTIQTTDQLFIPSGNRLYEGESIPEEELDINIVLANAIYACVRVERQVLHRLPQPHNLLFSFMTMLYTLPEIKEGLGEVLAEAIERTKLENAPEFYIDKRAVVWGESAKVYLRS
ncbi:hypothetical protein N7495_008718 [Penicillium taxi]|uniref:uncharacterized protein n=1 Tax=Penicillium taxi TaxID=168475 RepID=UPI00254508A4|nr:uncharacterized protein N7495_008718 [Penicillium taxi]KAJ5888677.1 hypothetical protein N7495_008718 [Penicillium taxi]